MKTAHDYLTEARLNMFSRKKSESKNTAPSSSKDELPKKKTVIDIDGTKVTLEPSDYEDDDPYIVYTWKDKNGKERYEETPVFFGAYADKNKPGAYDTSLDSPVNNLNRLKWIIKQEVDYYNK